jgi:Ca2+-binding RTX toxin-like protein
VLVRAVLTAITFTVATAGAALAPAAAAQAAVTCHGVRATIVGTSASDVIHGTSGGDVIAGLGGGDTIFGGAGNDLVCGGNGADHLNGRAGRDALYGEHDRVHVAQEDGIERVGDTLRGGPGDDRLRAGADSRHADIITPDVLSWDEAAHGVHIDLRTRTAHGEGDDTFGGGTFQVVGSSHGDTIDGTDRRDRIDTGPGPDVVRAHGGPDVVVVDSTHRGSGGDTDKVLGGVGADSITAGRGRDHLSGGPGNDRIEDRSPSNDQLTGGRGADQIVVEIGDGDAPQSFRGGGGFDTLALSSERINARGAASTADWKMVTGAMTFTLDHEITLSATDIDRAIFATPGTSWTVTGTAGDDFVSLSGGPRTGFDALAGDDVFRGSDGDDVFNGGPGQDHSLGMFDGDDTCTSVETIDGADCEHVS